MKILVANLGSTSFKYRLFDLPETVGAEGSVELARGGVERIGAGESRVYATLGDQKLEATMPVAGRPAPAPPGTPVTGSANQSGAPAARGRWGIGSRPDPCEPSAPVVVRVSPGSPAATGGLLPGDRLIAIDGAEAANQEEILARLKAAGDTVSIDVDRRDASVHPTEPGEREARGALCALGAIVVGRVRRGGRRHGAVPRDVRRARPCGCCELFGRCRPAGTRVEH
jgi:membrane-associated protease RseP (regulator of RpoE activity)